MVLRKVDVRSVEIDPKKHTHLSDNYSGGVTVKNLRRFFEAVARRLWTQPATLRRPSPRLKRLAGTTQLRVRLKMLYDDQGPLAMSLRLLNLGLVKIAADLRLCNGILMPKLNNAAGRDLGAEAHK